MARRFWRAVNYLEPAIGRTPYWVWEDGIIPDGAGAWAENAPPPPIGRVSGPPGIFCAGVTNLILRHAKKRVPFRLNFPDPRFDGGIAAYWDGELGPGYYHEYEEPFNLRRAERWANRTNCGVIVGHPYSGPQLANQGHIAVVLPRHTDGENYVLQSNFGDGLNWSYTIEQSHDGGYYTTMVHPENWLLYQGDEF
jgi:hypothetical protein